MARHARHHRLPGLGALVVTLLGLMSGCEGQQPLGFPEVRSATAALDGAEASSMRVYSPRGGPVDDGGFTWLGPTELLGGRVLEGEPRIFGRIDYSRNGVTAGLFKATKGKIEVTFPFSEHATILEGEVTITDATGQSHTYKAGDSYFMRQGSVVIWEVTGKQVIKSFLNTVEAP